MLLPKIKSSSLRIEFHALHRLGNHLSRYQEGKAGITEKKAPVAWATVREEFISHKLTPKLAQQLKVCPTIP